MSQMYKTSSRIKLEMNFNLKNQTTYHQNLLHFTKNIKIMIFKSFWAYIYQICKVIKKVWSKCLILLLMIEMYKTSSRIKLEMNFNLKNQSKYHQNLFRFTKNIRIMILKRFWAYIYQICEV